MTKNGICGLFTSASELIPEILNFSYEKDNFNDIGD